MEICVVGTGYVGLVTGVCLAEIGHNVMCTDTNAEKIAALSRGEVPIYEPKLDQLIAANLKAKRLRFSTSIEDVCSEPRPIFILAVGTPSASENGDVDLTQVNAAAETIARALAARKAGRGDFAVIVTKSTVPVGTCRTLDNTIAKILPRERYAVVSNPEFLREGNAVYDFMKSNRIVIGSDSAYGRAVVMEMYGQLGLSNRQLCIAPNPETSELIKYASNAFLATKITFINELSQYCEKIGADIEGVANGIGMDPRIGNMFLKPGPGYGGSCFPKDTAAIALAARQQGQPLQIVEAAIKANLDHQRAMSDKIIQALGGTPSSKRVALLGLAFKANTDDVRYSPAFSIMDDLKAAGVDLRLYDPVVPQAAVASRLGSGVSFAKSLDDALDGADAAVIVTEWSEFAQADWPTLARRMRRPMLVDLRNLFAPETARHLGVTYVSVGRETVESA
jgi:UDPglucose 6-dehydrogenase